MQADNQYSENKFTDQGELFDRIFPQDPEVSEQQKKDLIKIFQQRGFQLFRLENAEVALNYEIGLLRSEKDKKAHYHRWQCEEYLVLIREKSEAIKSEIDKVTSVETECDSDVRKYKEERKEIYNELKAIKQKLAETRAKLAADKKNICERLLLDAEKDLQKMQEIQDRINEELKKANEGRFAPLKSMFAVAIDKLKERQAKYEERFNELQIKVKSLGGEGINLAVAYTLLTIGSATAGIAGYFFSIFSRTAGYSSSDVFNLFFEGIVRTASGEEPLYLKFLYFLTGVIAMTFISYSLDLLTIRFAGVSSGKNEGEPNHVFAAEFKNEAFQYKYWSKEKGWFAFWLKIAPLILVVGTLILLITYKRTATDSGNAISELSAATEGLLIGTGIAIALSGIYYLYLTKVAEKRNPKGESGSLRYNWELVASMFVLLISVSLLMFHPGVSDNWSKGMVMKLSVIGFLGTSIGTAIIFSYGLRFSGLLLSLNEVEEYLLMIDNRIANYSVPKQQFLSLQIERYFEKLRFGIQTYLDKKNEAILDPEKSIHIRYSVENPEQVKSTSFFGHVFPRNKNNHLNEHGSFDMLDWEIVYFPEYAESIRTLANLHDEKQRELQMLDANIKQRQMDKEAHESSGALKKKKLSDEKDELLALHGKALIYCNVREEKLQRELDERIVCLRDGFELARWYEQRSMVRPDISNN